MRCNTYIETKLQGGGLQITECIREAELDDKCYMCLYNNLVKDSDSKINRIKEKLRKVEAFEKVVRDMCPKYMSIVDGTVEVIIKESI